MKAALFVGAAIGLVFWAVEMFLGRSGFAVPVFLLPLIVYEMCRTDFLVKELLIRIENLEGQIQAKGSNNSS